MSFFQTNEFFSYFVMPTPALWVSTRSPRHCGCVDTQHRGVQSVFRWLQAHLKKMGKFCDLKKKCRNSSKNGQKCPKSKSPNLPIKNLLSLQISAHLVFKWLRKSKIITFFPKSVFLPPKSGHFGFSWPFEGQMS